VNRVAQIAKRQNHHPQIKIDYNEIALTIWTHEQEAITDKDIEFALSADSAYEASK
jgi:4a-hydroxytetrahydrobiopterin dehydratase